MASAAAAAIAGEVQSAYKRVIMFVDNAGADVVLGMLPLARELLRMGAEVGGWVVLEVAHGGWEGQARNGAEAKHWSRKACPASQMKKLTFESSAPLVGLHGFAAGCGLL